MPRSHRLPPESVSHRPVSASLQRRARLVFSLIFGIGAAWSSSFAQTATVTTLHRFAPPIRYVTKSPAAASVAPLPPTTSDAGRPTGSLVDGGDGYLYGTSIGGGDNQYGVVYRINTTTGVTETLHSFVNDGDSAYPVAGLTLLNGVFYGLTTGDGYEDSGSIFSITAPTAAAPAVFQTLRIFEFGSSEPNEPRGTLVDDGNGLLYGTSVSGGSSNSGTIFTYDTISDGGVRVAYSFTGGADGYSPVAGLTSDGEGSFYGVTCRSNSSAYYGANVSGTVFRFTPGSDSSFQTIYSFTGGVDGAQPCDDLVFGPDDGNLYGTTTSGGQSDNSGTGTVFRVTTDGVLTTLYNFTDTSDGPPNALVLGPDGNFYGSSEGNPVGDYIFLVGRSPNPGPGDGTAGTLFRITPDGSFANLYSFTGGSANPNDGARPLGSLLLSNGYFYGVTYAGGNGNGPNLGTVFQADVFGAISLGASATTVGESAGYAVVVLNRTGGTSGEVSANYNTADGTATAGSDYTASNGAVVWADGDGEPKSVLVPIINDTVIESTESFTLALRAGDGFARFQVASPITITINDDDTPSTTPTPSPTPTPTPSPTPTPTPIPGQQATIVLTSPPTDVSIDSGTDLPLVASVADTGANLSRVQFLINGVPFGQLGADAPYFYDATNLAAGTYQIKAVVTDRFGRQNTSETRVVTVVAPDPNNPAPQSEIVTDLNGRAFAGGSIVPVTSMCKSPVAGDKLQSVTFYADGVPFASFDGDGNPTTGSARPSPVRQAALLPFGNNSVFTANFTMPGTNKLVSMITVALSKLGRAQVSSPVTLQAVAGASDKPPTVKLNGPSNGARFRTGTPITVPVIVTDPDGGRPSMGHRAPVRKAFDTSAVISRVEYYLNTLKVKDAAEAPLTYTVQPPAAGVYVLSAIATDGAGLATVSDPVTITAFDPTVISIKPFGLVDLLESDRRGKAFISREGGDMSIPLTVYYQISGTATNGVDYTGLDGQPLSGQIVVPAGASNVRLKFQPLQDNVVEGTETVKIKLLASPTGEYDLGGDIKTKLFIHDQ